ncbi:MAG: Ig-like domain-containing protein [Gammaproteobacteria bacterium]|nr:Ig-like domain-containing protein [Gammaproteobacteria bacterium]
MMPPTSSTTGAITVDEDNTLMTVPLTVIDEESGLQSVQLGVASGVLTVADQGTATSTGNGSPSITVSGADSFDIEQTVDTLTYTPDPDFSGTDTLSVAATDDGPLTTSDAFTITVTGVDDPAVANPATFNVDENATLSDTLPITDPDDPPEVDAVGGGGTPVLNSQFTLFSGALLTVNSDGTFSYDPNGIFDQLATGETNTDSFTYTAHSSTATVTITIDGVTLTPSTTGNSTSWTDTAAWTTAVRTQ